MASGQANLLRLSDLNPSMRRVAVCARVARVWEFNKDRKLAHLDIVFIDEQGNKMYAEIAAAHADKFKPLLQEGNLCLVRDFFVQSAKNMFKAVDGRFMMKVTPWTKIEVQANIPADFPRYAYSLTEFGKLPSLVGKPESFIDVLGIISAISDVLTVRLPGFSTDSVKRNLQIMDLDGRTVDVALWGTHAKNFDGEELYKYGQYESLIVLLVGTLIKSYRGRETISCGEAAKIYINPEIPEKIEYCERLGLQLPSVTWMAAADDQYSIAFKKSEPEEINIAYLLSTDPNDYLGKNMVSTVTLLRLASEVWWFLSCMACHKKAYAAENEFVCSDSKCNCIAAAPRYKLRIIGVDTTGEVEFIFFANAAEQVIGKKIDALTRAASRRPNTVPAEITTLISQKFTLNHSVNEKGLHYGELSFQVNSVTAVHQKANVFEFNQLSSGSNKSILNEVSTSSQSSVPTLKDIAEEHSTGVDTENNKLHQPEISENSNPIQTEEISVHYPSATADKSPPLTMTPETHMSLTKQSPETINDTGTKAKGNSAKRTSTDGKKSTAQKKLNMGAPEENAT